MPKILPRCKDGFTLLKDSCRCIRTLKKRKEKRTKNKTLSVKKLKRKIRLKAKKQSKMSTKKKSYNSDFVKVLDDLIKIEKAMGKMWEARAAEKAKEAILRYPKDITSSEQLVGIPFIGKKTISKLQEFIEGGKVSYIEKHKNHPALLFNKIYGVGPKKTKSLIAANITTIEDLSNNKDVLNEKQQLGLRYYYDLLERIPRKEIIVYKSKMQTIFDSVKTKNCSFKIVGSFRREVPDSGDIDIIITNKQNDRSIYDKFLDALETENIILEFLSRGEKKSYTICKLPYKYARRVDFMYCPPQEYAWAILYFTGSAGFNTVMRHRALDLGYTMNEHEICKMFNREKGPKVDLYFKDERAIFDFLGLVYKEPRERKSGKDVIIKEANFLGEPKPQKKNKKIKLKKKKQPKKQLKAQTKQQLLLLDQKGIDEIQSLSETNLSQMLLMANDYYYNKKSVIGDGVYDILKSFIEKKFPNCEALEQTGAPIKTKKTTLPYFLGSMKKSKPDTGALLQFKSIYKGRYVLSAKLDGISALYTTEGATPKLYTRGNGFIGKDISHLIHYLGLPLVKGIAMRGELIMAIELFNKKYKILDFKNVRSFISGAVGQGKRDPSKWKDIRFVAYELIKPVAKPSSQYKWLTDNYKHVVKHMIRKNITNESLSKFLLDLRENYEYNTDGVIVVNNKIYPRTTDKYPKHAFAFKMVLSDQMAESIVTDVLWSPSKDGFLKPRVQYEPVFIGGSKLEFATAYNASFVRDNKIGIGAVIKVIKSGDVIPKIHDVTTPAEAAKMPTVPFKWNKTDKEAIMCNAQKDATVRTKNITKFFQDLEIERLGPGNIKRIIEAGYDSIPKILKMKKGDFMEVEGFKDKLSTTVCKNIKEGVEKASLPILMKATNLLGRGMGERRIIMILNHYPTILTDAETPDEKIEKILNIKGFAKKTAELFVHRIPAFLEFVQSIKLHHKLDSYSVVQKTEHPLANKSIVITGFRDKELAEKIQKVTGKKPSSNVSKNTFVVLVKDLTQQTGKASEARDKGVPLMTAEEFIKKYL